jgi:hypothetical protein
MSHAPFDPEMVGRYGLAAYPFRDTEGNVIPDGEDVGGTYPWVDREGANVFMTGVQGRLVEQSHEDFPRCCVVEGCEDYYENNDWDRGFIVGGLWTHGKFVHLDALINNMDWAVGVTPASHFWVDLYRTPEGDPVPVRFGAGRFIDSVRNAGGPYPDGYTHNANILDSVQNLLNHHPSMRPVTPRDVVWIMSSGIATDEVEFDDFLDRDALIVAHMQGSITQMTTEDGQTLGVPIYWNGQHRDLLLPLAVAQFVELQPEVDAEVHVQNAATSPRWNPPSYGYMAPGTGRIEPVAIGGIKGKGLWLSGDASVTWALPEQPRPVDDLYLGVFVDGRADEAEERAVVTFPDGTGLHVRGRSTAVIVQGDQRVREIALPPGQDWVHLGVVVEEGGRRVTFLHNGFALDRFESPIPLFRAEPGDITLGAPQDDRGFAGFRGWIDDFVVFAYAPNVEVRCNHARGTLIRVGDDAWSEHTARYPDWAHAAVAEAAAAATGDSLYACYHDYSDDYAAHLGNLPEGAEPLRDAITFPEGPIRAGVPRPDSTGNAFCLTCHGDDGRGGMSTRALEPLPGVAAEHDRRRQPMQGPARVRGNVPAGWLTGGEGPGSPAEPLRAPPEGLLVDPWVLPPGP